MTRSQARGSAREILKIVPLVMRTVAAELRAAGELPAPAHFHLLTMLSDQSRTLTELASLLGVSLPTMSNSISALEQRGWVRRTAPTRDRRVVIIEVTPMGKATVLRVGRCAETHLAEALAPLDGVARQRLRAGLGVLRKVFANGPRRAYNMDPRRVVYMTNVATSTSDPTGSGTAASKGLIARAIGVIVSPRETYADIAAHPRVLGALLLVLLVVVGASTAFLFTQVGKDALFDQQIRTMESFGVRINDQMYAGMEQGLQWAPYTNAVFLLVIFPVSWAVIAGIILGVFNAVMGGDATFKQVYAIVVQSGSLIALQQLFIVPLNYARQSMSSPTNLAVFFPFLDETSFVAMLLGGIDLFFIWVIVNQAIGIGVLYKRKTAPIAMTMLGIYVSIVLIVAGVRSALSGA